MVAAGENMKVVSCCLSVSAFENHCHEINKFLLLQSLELAT